MATRTKQSNARTPAHAQHVQMRIVDTITIAVLACALAAFAGTASIATNSSNAIASVSAATLVDLANADRSDAQSNELIRNPLLDTAAQLKATDMATRGYFSHTSPDGKAPWYWFKAAGYDYSAAGENLAVDFADARALQHAWMESPKHRKNILSKGFTEIGIATADGMYQGHPSTFVVQLFATPHAATATQRSATTARNRNAASAVLAQDAAHSQNNPTRLLPSPVDISESALREWQASPQTAFDIWIAVLVLIISVAAFYEMRRSDRRSRVRRTVLTATSIAVCGALLLVAHTLLIPTPVLL